MECKYCENSMKLITADDNPNTGFAHNVYYCEECETLLHNRVWENRGNTWIRCDGTVEVEEDVKLEPCPKCGGDVELICTRDLNVYETCVSCENCQLFLINHETPYTSSKPLDLLIEADANLITSKWNSWCKTKPKYYCEESWE